MTRCLRHAFEIFMFSIFFRTKIEKSEQVALSFHQRGQNENKCVQIFPNIRKCSQIFGIVWEFLQIFSHFRKYLLALFPYCLSYIACKIWAVCGFIDNFQIDFKFCWCLEEAKWKRFWPNANLDQKMLSIWLTQLSSLMWKSWYSN